MLSVDGKGGIVFVWDRVFDPVAARSAAGFAHELYLSLKETAALRAAAGSLRRRSGQAPTRPHTETEAQKQR